LLTLKHKLPYSILILDQEPVRFFKTIPYLQEHFFKVLLVDTISAFELHLLHDKPDAVLIRLDFAQTDAISYMQELKKRFDNDIKIILFKDPPIEDYAVELALQSGADGVIHFQYKAAILTPFMRNLLRRKKSLQDQLKISDFIIDDERFEVRFKNIPIVLPKKEFNLLKILMDNPDHIFTKEELSEVIWNDIRIAQKRTIDVHVYNIRKAIHKLIIKSYKGKGYRYNQNFLSVIK
jgi:DNA-binding response OmpR family regulator